MLFSSTSDFSVSTHYFNAGAKSLTCNTGLFAFFNIMSTSAPHLAEFPTEILEHVFLHLPGQDIIKTEAVGRRFRDLVRDSPTLQHQRGLFAASLIDNPCNPCDLDQRRQSYEQHAHKWSKTATIAKRIHELPPDQQSRWVNARHIGRNVLVSYPTADCGLGFLYVPPPAASQQQIEVWSIPLFPFKLFALAVYHPDKLLAVAELDGSLLRIHLLNLRDGSPYCAPPFNAIIWDTSQAAPPTAGNIDITGSRIMIYILHSNAAVGTVLVWDRKTRDLALNLPAMNLEGATTSRVILLDEFRVMLTTRNTSTNTPEFVVFNTLIPQDHPMSSRRFGLPPRFDDKKVLIHVDRDRPSGTETEMDSSSPTQSKRFSS